jgi:mannose PTS system EIIA component
LQLQLSKETQVIGIVLVAHAGIGEALLETASGVLGSRPDQVEAVSVPFCGDLAKYQSALDSSLNRVDSGDGVLLLADILGASPCNLAQRGENHRIGVVTGLNLGMLLKVIDNRKNDLDELVDHAVRAGQRSVIELRCDHA